MILRLIALGLLIASSSWAVDWKDGSTPAKPGKFPPPRPVHAVYGFGWSGVTAASAEYDLTKPAANQMRLDMKTRTTGAVRALWRLDAVHMAVCALPSQRPIRLQQTEVYKDETEVQKAEFFPDSVQWRVQTTPKGPPPKDKRLKCAGVYDLLTGLLFVRSQPLQTGDAYRMTVFPAKAAYVADVEVLGRETLKVKAGTFDAIKCQVRVQGISKKLELEPHKKFKRAFAWISNDRDRLLLKIEAEVFVGSVWAELQSATFKP